MMTVALGLNSYTEIFYSLQQDIKLFSRRTDMCTNY
jgi:hypothetical protein